MAGPKARRHPYSGTALASLRLAAALALASACGGCAVSGVGSLFGRSDAFEARAQTSDDITGSTGARQSSPTGATSALPSDTDLVFARMAVVEVLRRDGKETSAPWENPSSGARGTVTPIASAYVRDGATCRDFLASYVKRQGSQTWLQGEACQVKKGAWEVKSLRPWTRS